MPPFYCTPDTMAGLLDRDLVPQPILCPHCGGLLLPARAAAPKTAASGDGKRPPTGSGDDYLFPNRPGHQR